MNAAFNPISGVDPPFGSLQAAAATGAGTSFIFSRPCRSVAMQVTFTGGSPTVKVYCQGSIDGTNWFTLATFDTGASNASGDIVASSTIVCLAVRANIATLSGGTNPTVSALIQGSPYV